MSLRGMSPAARRNKLMRKRELNSEGCLPKYVIPFKMGVYDMRIVSVYPMKTIYGDRVVMELQGEVNGATIKETKFFDGGYRITDQSELGILLSTLGAVDQTNHIQWKKLDEARVSVTFDKKDSDKAYIKKIEPLAVDEGEAYAEDYEEDEDEAYAEDYEEDYEEDEDE